MIPNKESNISCQMTTPKMTSCQCCINRGPRTSARQKWLVMFGVLMLQSTASISAMTLSNKTPGVVHGTNGDPAPGRSPGPPGLELERRFEPGADTWTSTSRESDVEDYARGDVEVGIKSTEEKDFEEKRKISEKSRFDNSLQRKHEKGNSFIRRGSAYSYKVDGSKIYRGEKVKDVNVYKDFETSRVRRGINEIFDGESRMESESDGLKSENKDKNLKERLSRQERSSEQEEGEDMEERRDSYLVGEFVRNIMRNQRSEREMPDAESSAPIDADADDDDDDDDETQTKEYFVALAKRGNDDKMVSVRQGADITDDVHNNDGDHPTLVLTAQPAVEPNATWCEEVLGVFKPEVVGSEVDAGTAERMNVSVFHERFKPEMGIVAGVSYRVSIMKVASDTSLDYSLTSLVDGVPIGAFSSRWDDNTCPISDASFAGRLGDDKASLTFSWSVTTSVTPHRDANVTFRLQYRLASDPRIYEIRSTFLLLKDCRLWLWPSFSNVSWQHLPTHENCQLSIANPSSDDTGAPRGLVVELTRLNVPCLSGGSLRFGTGAAPLCGKLEELPVSDRRVYFPSILSSTTTITLHRNPLFSFTYYLVDYCYNVNLTKNNDSVTLKSTSSGLRCTFRIHLPYGNRISLRLRLRLNSGKPGSLIESIQNYLPEEDYRIGDSKSGEMLEMQPVIDYGDGSQENVKTPTLVRPRSFFYPGPTFKSPERNLDESKLEDYEDMDYPKFVEEYPDGRPSRTKYNDVIGDVKTLKTSSVPSPDDCSRFRVRIRDDGKLTEYCYRRGENNGNDKSLVSNGNSLILQVLVGELSQGGLELTLSYSAESVREIVRECDYGWVSSEQFCVTVVDDRRASWEEAEVECVTRGGHLASVRDENAQRVVDSLLRNSAGYRDHNSYWIGASDRIYEGDFRWTDGQQFFYTNWFPGWEEHGHSNRQPNDDGYSDQDCVELRRGYLNAGNHHRPPTLTGGSARLAQSFMWNDRDCATNNFFVCEKLKKGEPLLDNWSSECNRSLVLNREQPRVSVTSPGFPRQYPDNAECLTTIVAPADHRIVVDFEEMVLEKEPNCSYDFLEILEDGHVATTNRSATPRKLCDDWSSRLKLLRYVSRGPQIRMRFVSDYSHHYGGFKVKVAMENAVTVECGDDRLQLFNHSCYMIVSFPPVSWHTARQVCKERKFELASIRNAQEHTFVTSKIRAEYSTSEVYWLGGQKAADKDSWTWLDDSAITSAPPGGSGFPMCLALLARAKFQQSGHHWQAQSCETMGGFVCKREIQVTGSFLNPNRTVNGSDGFLTTPRFPDNYNNNLDYWVQLNGPSKTRIVVTFTRLDLEPQDDCLYDFVEMQSEMGGGDRLRWCGNYENNSDNLSFVSVNNRAILHFHSDYSISGLGYSANWQAVDISGCPLKLVNASKGGIVSSPYYPHFMLSHLDCTTDITTQGGKRIWLEFTDHNITSTPNDASLELVLGGVPVNPFQQERQLNSGIFVSVAGRLLVQLRTGDRPTGTGYLAKYKTMSQIREERTISLTNSTTGYLYHLNYPSAPPANVDYSERLVVPLGSTIFLEFHGAFLNEDGTSCANDAGAILVTDRYADGNGTSWLLCEAEAGQKVVMESYLNSLTVRQKSRDTAIKMEARLIVKTDAKYKSKLIQAGIEMNLESCTPNPCQHGGKCVQVGSQRRCQCTLYYTGPFCGLTICERQPCQRGKCKLTETSFSCLCEPGFIGKTCGQIQQPCSDNPCDGRGDCTIRGDTFHCRCHAWWEGPKCEKRMKVPFKPLSQRMLEEPFWLGLITVTVVLGVIGIIWCAKRHFPEKLEKLLADEADRSRGGSSYLRPASVREQLAASSGAATVAVPSPTPAGGGCPRSLLGRLGIRKPSLLSLTSPHGHSHSVTARTFSLDDLLKPPPRSKLGKTGLVGV